MVQGGVVNRNLRKFGKIFLGVILVAVLNIGFVGRAYALAPTDLILLANTSRSKEGLANLTSNDRLTKAAYNKANDMLEHDYFAHTSPDGKTPWDFIKAAGYNYAYAGENLAIGYTNASELHQAWMNSPTHRENILNGNFREIGLAVVSGEYEGSQTTVVVQMFGQSAGAAPAEPTAAQVESSQTAQTPAATADRSKTFTIIKDKTGFTPGKIFSGEEVTFKVVLTGAAQDILVTCGEQKINLQEVVSTQQQDSEKTFQKKEKIAATGDLKTILQVTDKWGNREVLEMGTLTVAPKAVAKSEAPTQNTALKSVQNNAIVLFWMTGFLGLGLVAVAIFRRYKYGKLV